MRRRPAGIRRGGRGAIELALEPPRELLVGLGGGSRQPWRRHRPGLQLLQNLFEDRGVIRNRLQIDAGLVEIEIGGVQTLIVAAGAVAIEHGAIAGGGGGLGLDRRRGERGQQYAAQHDPRDRLRHEVTPSTETRRTAI